MAAALSTWLVRLRPGAWAILLDKFELRISFDEDLIYAQHNKDPSLKILVATHDDCERKDIKTISERMEWIRNKYICLPVAA